MSRVALLGREDQVRAQLRAALLDAGAEVALECDLTRLKLDELRACEAETVIVNLDPGSEDALDQLDDLIADPDVRVVFNESETTGQLAGWDLARWARHLVAKVVGHGDSTPPPPPGAELLPLRDLSIEPGAPLVKHRETGQQDLNLLHEEAAASSSDVPSSPRIEQTAAEVEPDEIVTVELEPEPEEPSADELAIGSIEREPMHEEPPEDAAPVEVKVIRPIDDGNLDRFSLDVGEIEGALAGIEAGSRPGLAADAEADTKMPRRLGPDEPTVVISRGDLEKALEAAAESAEQLLPADSSGSAADSSTQARSQADGMASPGALPRRLGPDEPTTVLPLGELDAELNELAAEIAESPLDSDQVADLDLSLEMADLADDHDLSFDAGSESGQAFDEFGLDEVSDGAAPLVSQDFEDDDLSLDDDVAALAAQFDALSADKGGSHELVDDFSSGLSLESVDDGGLDTGFVGSDELDVELEQPAVQNKEAAPAETPTPANAGTGGAFGELSLMDLDAAIEPSAPVEKKSDKGFDFSSLSLSLEPLDEGAEAVEEAPGAAPVAVAPAIKQVAGISRVVVLAASIGGPDAVRSFLGGIPKDFPALFLLSQHLESGFFGRLSQQLQKVTPLTVRVAERGADPVHNGEVIVVPSGAVYSFAQDGRIESFEYSDPPRYKPCIDDLLREASSIFGNKVTAIVFSGMAGDGVEGAAEVTRKGGEVWAQSPASCVVSSMVDGVLSRGVVEFVGTPRELAERMVQKYAAG